MTAESFSQILPTDTGESPPPESAAGPQEPPLLHAINLHTWFEIRRFGLIHVGSVRAVDGVEFSLARGESVAFVGESGCGKSSLIRTLLGLHRPTHGDVVFEGESLATLDSEQLHAYRSRVGYVQQDPYGALPPFMPVRNILAEPLIVHGVRDRAEREKRIRAVLEEVRLSPPEEFLHKFPHMLSGGQQQRVVIARALILNPVMIVADEPVSMLDASVRVEILNLLRNIQRTHNLALVFITHDLSTVRYFARRIFVMYAGKVVEEAPVDDLLEAPQHPYTQALLRALPDPDPENAKHDTEVPGGEPPSLLNPPSGCRFHPRCSQFMPGICDVEIPPQYEPRPQHHSACWLQHPDGAPPPLSAPDDEST